MSDLSVAEWVSYLFDHPVTDPAWHFDVDSPYLQVDAERAAELIAETFEASGTLLAPFTDAQLNQGFWFLVSPGNSGYMCCLTAPSVAWSTKQRVLRSFVPLFRDVMAARCSPVLRHLDESGSSTLNSACFMWWDLLPLDESDGPEALPASMRGEVLAVLSELLEIPHDACQESALHGLGHWALWHAEARGVIERFIDRSEGLRVELVAYARMARTGCIL